MASKNTGILAAMQPVSQPATSGPASTLPAPSDQFQIGQYFTRMPMNGQPGAVASPSAGGTGSMSSSYVQQLYNQLLGRNGTAAEVDYYNNLMNNGATPTDIRNDFLNSPEYQADVPRNSANASYASLMHAPGAIMPGQGPTGSTPSGGIANAVDSGNSGNPFGGTRTYNPVGGDMYNYGMGPEHLFFSYSGTPANAPPAVASVPPGAASIGVGGDGTAPDIGNAARGGVIGFAKGGLVRSATPGRTDQVETEVPEGTYIVPADAVSGLGQGNTEAGDRLWAQLEQEALRHHPVKAEANPRMVKVKLSGGERKILPHVVTAAGKGSHQRGADSLEKLIGMIRAGVARHLATGQPPRR